MRTRLTVGRCCCGGCRYSIESQLSWDDPVNRADLDMYVRDVDLSEVAYYANPTITTLRLNGDRYPNCFNTGPDDEVITGGPFETSKEFEAWYNQFSDCAPELSPHTKFFRVRNIGGTTLTVNGTSVAPGGSWETEPEYAGYNTGRIPTYTPASSIVVQCPGAS